MSDNLLSFDLNEITHFAILLDGYSKEGQGNLDILTLAVDDLTDNSWTAPAALEFKEKFNTWSKDEYFYYETLQDMKLKIFRTVEEWRHTNHFYR